MNNKELCLKLNDLEQCENIEWKITRQSSDDQGRYRIAGVDENNGGKVAAAVYSIVGFASDIQIVQPGNISKSQMEAIISFIYTPDKDKWYMYHPITLTEKESEAIARNCFLNNKVSGEDYNVMNQLVHKVRKSLQN